MATRAVSDERSVRTASGCDVTARMLREMGIGARLYVDTLTWKAARQLRRMAFDLARTDGMEQGWLFAVSTPDEGDFARLPGRGDGLTSVVTKLRRPRP